jgi:hypothetical protein
MIQSHEIAPSPCAGEFGGDSWLSLITTALITPQGGQQARYLNGDVTVGEMSSLGCPRRGTRNSAGIRPAVSTIRIRSCVRLTHRVAT